MVRVAKPSRSVESSGDGILDKFRQFVFLKGKIDDYTKEQSVIKTELSTIVDEQGEVDDKGHIWYQLPEEVGGYRAIKRERRVSQTLDLEEAERILKEKGLETRCFTMMPVLNEDAVMSCLYEGLLTEEEIDKMYPKKVSWAFVPSKT